MMRQLMDSKASLLRRLWRFGAARKRKKAASAIWRIEPLESRALLSVSPQGGTFALEWEDLGLTGERTEVSDGLWFLGTGFAPHQVALREPENAAAADTTNTDQLWSGGGLGLNLTGAGLTVGIWDQGGVRTTHNELIGRVTIKDGSPLADHSTHVAGTIGASGVIADARGMASQVNILSYNWDNDYTELQAEAANIVASNHSYAALTGWSILTTGNQPGFPSIGLSDVWFEDRSLYSVEDPKFGKYDSSAAQLDALLANNPNLLSVWASGNDRDDNFGNVHFDQTYVTYLSSGPQAVSGPGWYQVSTAVLSAPAKDGGPSGYDSLPPTQTAKNSLVVGAVSDITADPYTSGAITAAGFSSAGPTDDGRIKPDLVANGVGVFSSTANSNGSYITMSGTSMAAPNVTGTAALLAQHYKNLFSGQLPSSATQKALMIHTAFDAGNVGPDYLYGWGLLDAAAAANLLTAAAGVNPTQNVLNRTYTGAEQTFQFTVSSGSALKATIAWVDPAGTAQGAGVDISTSVLINDLDIWVTGPDGTYHPWNLDPSNPTAAAFRNSANHRDNVEQVLFTASSAGTYTLHVGRTGASFNQAYSLIVSGGTLDAAAPAVDILDVTPDPRNSAATAITIQFSEAVTGFDLADLTLTRNGGGNLLTGSQTLTTSDNITYTLNNLAGLTGTAGNYVLTLNPVGAGIQDLSSNLLISGASDSWTVDLTAPTADIVDVTPDPRNSGVGSITIVFNEAVAGFNLADLSLTRNGGANLLTGSQTLSTSDNVTFTLNNLAGLTATSGNYLLTLTAAGAGISDAAGNALVVNASDAWTVDAVGPTVDIVDVAPDPRNSAVSTISIVFSKAVTGFDLSDLSLTLNGGVNLLTAGQTLTTSNNITFTLNNVAALTGSSGNYLLTLVAAGSGIIDVTANPLTVGATDAWVVDVTPPTVDIVDVTPDPRTTSVPSISIVFSEAVTGFDLADLSLTLNGGPNLLTGSQTLTTGNNITFTLNNLAALTAAPGSYVLTLNAAGAGIADSLGNALTGSANDAWFMSLTEIQAENFTRRTSGNGHQWSIVDSELAGVGSFTGATGPSTDFMQSLTLAGQDSTQGSISGPAAPFLEYDVTIATAGVYSVKLRVAGISSASDSLWFDSTTATLSDPQGNDTVGGALKIDTSVSGAFQIRDAGKWQLSAGTHTFRVSMRESGAAIDALQIIAPTSTAIAGPTEIQAENFSSRQDGIGHRWWVADLETPGAGVFTGATGAGLDYVQSLNLAGQDTTAGSLTPAAPYIDYTIEVPANGAYGLLVRTAGLNSSSDTLWVSIPTGTLQDAQGNPLVSGSLQIATNLTGVFENRSAGLWNLSAGTHTIRLGMRESGAAVDSLLVVPMIPVPIVGATEIQAENFARRQSGVGHQWTNIDIEHPGAGSFSGATGAGQDFLQSLSAAGQDTGITNLSPAAPYVEYDIQVSESGAYDLRLSVAGVSGTSDSLWVEVPTGSLNNAQGNATSGAGLLINTNLSGAFEYRNAGRWNLSAGTHTIRVAMRESGAAIDALQVVPPSVPTPIVGLTEIQAETFSRRQTGNGHQWWIVDQETAGAGAFTGATGPATDYLQSLTLAGADSAIGTAAPSTPAVEYDIQVSAPGTYELKLRVAGISSASDSLWVEVPTGVLTDAQGNAVTGAALRIETNVSGVFTLKNAGRWNLSAGAHTIRISMRESGAAIDALQISPVSAAAPVATAISAEARLGVAFATTLQAGSQHDSSSALSAIDQVLAGWARASRGR
jgi:hypothetical protein